VAASFEEHDLSKGVALPCDDTFSLVATCLGEGFVPE
jgi:hypothetical protein